MGRLWRTDRLGQGRRILCLDRTASALMTWTTMESCPEPLEMYDHSRGGDGKREKVWVGVGVQRSATLF